MVPSELGTISLSSVLTSSLIPVKVGYLRIAFVSGLADHFDFSYFGLDVAVPSHEWKEAVFLVFLSLDS